MPTSKKPKKKKRNRAHPAAGATKRSTITLNWSATWRAHKDRFDEFDYDGHNLSQIAAGRVQRVIGTRRAMLRTTARDLMYQAITKHPDRFSGRRIVWFPLTTKKGSIGTNIDRSARTVDTYLKDLLSMGVVKEQQREAHGIRLVLDPALFVFEDAAGKHVPPIPEAQEAGEAGELAAAEVPALTEQARAQMRAEAMQKIAENVGSRPLKT